MIDTSHSASLSVFSDICHSDCVIIIASIEAHHLTCTIFAREHINRSPLPPHRHEDNNITSRITHAHAFRIIDVFNETIMK